MRHAASAVYIKIYLSLYEYLSKAEPYIRAIKAIYDYDSDQDTIKHNNLPSEKTKKLTRRIKEPQKKEYESCATGPLEEVRSILNILAGITHYILQWGINISY